MTTATLSRPPTAVTPERSLTQRRSALQRANMVRAYRKELKRDLKAGRVSVQMVLLDPPEHVETMKIFDLLLHIPKIGRTKANKILQRCRVSPTKTLGGLSPRQRDELVRLLLR